MPRSYVNFLTIDIFMKQSVYVVDGDGDGDGDDNDMTNTEKTDLKVRYDHTHVGSLTTV